MIKINLLPREYAEQAAAQKKMVMIIAGVVVVLLLFTGSYFSKLTKLSSLENKIDKVDKELKKLKPVIDKVNAIEKKKSELNTKINVIKDLMNSRLYYPMFMEDLAAIMLKKVWLTSVDTKVTSGGMLVDLNLYAVDNYAVADFLNTLEKSNKFFDAKIFGKTIENKAINGINTVQLGSGQEVRTFTVNCSYYPSGEKPEAASAKAAPKKVKRRRPRRRR